MSKEKDKIFICQRCSSRIEKKGGKAPFYIEPEDLKNFKKDYYLKYGEKPSKRPVLTTCLGHCPKDAISFQETKDLRLQKAKECTSTKKEFFKKLEDLVN